MSRADVSSTGPTRIDLTQIIRANILQLRPYRCARDDFSEGILLDANENALGHAIAASQNSQEHLSDLLLHRYPDPAQGKIKRRLSNLRHVEAGPSAIFLGVGSDECIDLLIRITCIPAIDSILVCPPTYGMYSVCAAINDIGVKHVPLVTEGGVFLPDVENIMEALSTLDPPPKLLFLTSPGNPTSTLIPIDDVKKIAQHETWRGLIIVDEAYVDFSDPDNTGSTSAISLINRGFENIVVMQTLSKGFGLAGIRLGYSIQTPELSQYLANAKAPYNICTPTASLALRALSPESITRYHHNIHILLENRRYLISELAKLDDLAPVIGASHANFVLVPVLTRIKPRKPDSERANAIYKDMAETRGVVVRYRGNEHGCAGCLRITVGTRAECEVAIARLKAALKDI